jgi:acetyltransferase-like isoleucine patch superfamily enzyme
MSKQYAQHIIEQEGHKFIEYDWNPAPLPDNMVMDEMAYPDTSYSYTTCFSEKPVGFHLGYASGNYGHGIFTTGVNGEIKVGKYVVLQCTRIIANLSVSIHDHCMFSWGSVITDSWLNKETLNPEIRKQMLLKTAASKNRHIEFTHPIPVVIEENAWIGFEAIILPGVTIGRGAIVGSKSIITENVPPYAVMVGNPARIIKYLEPNDTDEVKQKAIEEFSA